LNAYNGYDHNQRMAAYRWLMKAYEAGTRTKPIHCDACLQSNGVVEPHSEDYSAPYGDNIGEYGLCYRCHMMVHCRYKNNEVWNKYLKLLREGYNFEGMSKNYHGFIAWLKSPQLWKPKLVNIPRAETALDVIGKNPYKR
jgi:hypothetical protein